MWTAPHDWQVMFVIVFTQSFGMFFTDICENCHKLESWQCYRNWRNFSLNFQRFFNETKLRVIFLSLTWACGSLSYSDGTSDSWSRGQGFESHPLRCRVRPLASRSRTPASVTEQQNLVLTIVERRGCCKAFPKNSQWRRRRDVLRAVHSRKAATGKARSPMVERQVRRTTSDEDKAEQRRWRASTSDDVGLASHRPCATNELDFRILQIN